MKKYSIILSIVALFAFFGCQKYAGDPISKVFAIEGAYTELEVEDAFDVRVDNTATQITVTAGEHVMPNVVVEIKENTLKIYLKGWHSNRGKDMTVILPYNAELTSVDLSGASEFRSEYGLVGKKVDVELSGASDCYCDIDADEVDLDLSGSSNFYGDIWADQIDMGLSGASNIEGAVETLELDLEMSGSSDATLEGEVTTLKIDLAGASSIVKKVIGHRYALVCGRCEGEMSGSSDAYIHCDGSIKVNLSGSSELHFTGDGNPADSHTSGGSDIVHDVL